MRERKAAWPTAPCSQQLDHRMRPGQFRTVQISLASQCDLGMRVDSTSSNHRISGLPSVSPASYWSPRNVKAAGVGCEEMADLRRRPVGLRSFRLCFKRFGLSAFAQPVLSCSPKNPTAFRTYIRLIQEGHLRKGQGRLIIFEALRMAQQFPKCELKRKQGDLNWSGNWSAKGLETLLYP